jgi:hypothetical protein
VFAFVLLAAAAVLAAKPVYNFKGGVKTRATKGITKQELKPMPDQSGFYSWTYTFMLYTDDNSSAMIQFTYWKYLLMSQHGLLFSFIDKGDKQILQKAMFKAEEVSYHADPPQLYMGRNYWKGFYPDFYLHLDMPAIEGRPAMKADLHLKCRTPGWRPGDGPVHYETPDGPWYDLIVVIPWADLDGAIYVGGQAKKIKGWGYSDHNTQTVFPTTQLSQLFALRSFSDNYAVNFLDYVAPPALGNTRSTWILVMKGNRILYATDKWERKLSDTTREPSRGYSYARRVEIKIDQPDCKLTGTIKGVKFLEAIDTMAELPSFIRPIAEQFVTAPVFIRQNATVDWRLILPAEGIDESFVNRGVFETTIVK